MSEKFITSADAIFLLSVTNVFNSPVQLQGFTADNMFGTDAVQPAEVVMGADGHLSAGLIFVAKKQKISLMPDSDSADLFDIWNEAQNTGRSIFFANATITFPATGKTYNLTRGVLTSFTPMPGAKKTLQPVEHEITWEKISAALV